MILLLYDNLLKKFSILIIEVHYLNALSTKSGLKLFDKFFSKILKNFYIYHMHANNCCGLNKIHEYDIPTVLEFGFIYLVKLGESNKTCSFPF